MRLGRHEATRIVRFCLAGDGWGTATTEDEVCVLKLVLNRGDRAEACQFEAGSFEDTLAQAVEAGVLKASCVAKQVAFITRESAADDTAPPGEGSSPSPEQTLFPVVTAAISALVHETQRERGVSSLYTASSGRRFGAELAEQWRATDQRRRELALFRERHTGRLPMAVAGQLAGVEGLLQAVTTARRRVLRLKLAPTEVIDVYSRLNGEILRVVENLPSLVGDALQRPTALAWIALLHAMEKTGIERAQLVSAFERDRYFDGQYEAVLGLIASRQSYLHLFAAAAPPRAGDLLREKLESEATGDVEQMEQIALAHQEGGFGVDPTAWFAAVSRRMDLLGDVESLVRGSLTP